MKNVLQSSAEVTFNQIVAFQTQRLGQPLGTFSASELGITQIQNRSNNLLKLISNGRIQLIEAKSANKNQVVFVIRNPLEQTIANVSGGTLLVPEFNQKVKTQTLIARKNKDFILKKGQNIIKLETLCFDRERREPKQTKYLLSNVKSIYYQEGMNQRQVWSITFNLDTNEIKRIQDWGSAENLILLNKDELNEALGEYEKQMKQQQLKQLQFQQNLKML